MIEYYENLTEDERKQVSDSIAVLNRQTFVLEQLYDKRNHRFSMNREFYQCDKHLEFIKAYFAIAGVEVVENVQLGIIYLRGEQVIGERLSKLATLYILVLKLIYDEQMAAVSSAVNVVTTVGAIHEKLGMYRLLKKEPSMSKIREALGILKRYQLIALSDALDQVDGYSKIVVYPTVNVVLLGDEVAALLDDFAQEDEEEASEEFLQMAIEESQ